MGEMKDKSDEVMETMKELFKFQPNSMKEFKSFMNKVLEDGVLDNKTKELIAIGTAITGHCKYCIAIHVKKALDAGATKEEILEAAMVSTLMGGGLALTYVTDVKKALDEYL